MTTDSYLTNRIIKKFNGKKLNNKIFIRRKLLDSIDPRTFTKNILMLTGSNYKRCIEELVERDLIGKNLCNIAIVERENKIFKQIYDQVQNCPFYQKNNVKLFKGNIKDINLYHYDFQDIDLMCTWIKGFEILRERLSLQLESHLNQHETLRLPKYFMFSLSEWGIKLKESYPFFKNLLEVLGCKVWGIDKNKGMFGPGEALSSVGYRSFIKRHRVYCHKDEWGYVKRIHLYRYRDTTNMLTCLIQYK
ncbi:MAG: hypothetical protein ACFFG0_03985 [Candidatus Thorarchaeota archaeon]